MQSLYIEMNSYEFMNILGTFMLNFGQKMGVKFKNSIFSPHKKQINSHFTVHWFFYMDSLTFSNYSQAEKFQISWNSKLKKTKLYKSLKSVITFFRWQWFLYQIANAWETWVGSVSLCLFTCSTCRIQFQINTKLLLPCNYRKTSVTHIFYQTHVFRSLYHKTSKNIHFKLPVLTEQLSENDLNSTPHKFNSS